MERKRSYSPTAPSYSDPSTYASSSPKKDIHKEADLYLETLQAKAEMTNAVDTRRKLYTSYNKLLSKFTTLKTQFEKQRKKNEQLRRLLVSLQKSNAALHKRCLVLKTKSLG